MNDQNQHVREDQLQAFLDGALEPAAAKLVQAHLNVCPVCQEDLASLEMVAARLDKLPELSLGKDFSHQVVEHLKDQGALSPAVTWTLVAEALAAGVTISLLIPAFQAAAWLPRILNTRLTLQAELNTFLTQLVNSWVVWWAELKLQLSQGVTSLAPLQTLSAGRFSPWILIGVAGSLMVVVNAFLVGQQSQPDQNHDQLKY